MSTAIPIENAARCHTFGVSQVAFKDETELRDRPWLKHYPSCVPAHLGYPAMPAWGLLERAAASHPDRVACHYYQQRLTYREMWAQSRRFASRLAGMGVRPGDRVGLLLPNTPEYLIALNGIWMAGGIAVAMSPLMVAEEVAGLVNATGCRVVVALDLLMPLLKNNKAQLQAVLLVTLKDRLPHWQRFAYAFARVQRIGLWTSFEANGYRWFNDEVGKGSDSFEPRHPLTLDEPAYILPTGGTTSHPKAVVLSHRNLIANAWQLFNWAGGRTGRETILAVLPFFHSYGLSTCAMTGVAIAATLVLHHRFKPRAVLRLIQQHKPTIFPAVPAMLVALNELLRTKKVDFGLLRFVMSGGAPLPPEVADEFARHSGAEVVEGFGLSEASPVTHSGPLDGTARPHTIGLPLPDTDARIVDIETGTKVLPPGEVGELVVRGPQVMLGYWNDPEATARAIRNGWLHTGDMAVCDDDGFFRIVDRIKDLIITSGFNVYPTDVEQVLRGFPGIADIAIVGVDDAHRGQIVKALVVMQKDVVFHRHAFDEFAREHLASHKRPREVEVVDGDLPRNFLGKVLRRKLRDMHVAPEGVYEPAAAEPAEATV